MTPLSLALTPTFSAAAEVRSAMREAVAGTAFEARLPDAEIAVSEIVTNAVLHGREPITVTIALEESLRVEVTDGSAVSPTFSFLDPTAVTGRGLLLVSAVADRWGVEPHDEGKTVWIELGSAAPTADAEADVDALLASWGDALAVDPAHECVRVVLTDLDVAALVASETHDEGVLRELALAGTASQVLVAAERFEAARTSIKQQVTVAVHRSQELVDIELSITRGDAELVRDYRAAMEAADRLCASGELLLEPHDTSLRTSYLNRILAQLGS